MFQIRFQFFLQTHFNLCSFAGLFNMPVTCRCHAFTCRPLSGRGTPRFPSPTRFRQHKSQSILHNALRAWLNGEASRKTASDVFRFVFASRSCVCIRTPALAPAPAHNGGAQTFYAAFVLLLHTHR